MDHSVRREQSQRLIQTVALGVAIALLAVRAASLLLGPVGGWLAVVLVAALSLNAAVNQRVMLPHGSHTLTVYDAPEIHRLVRSLSTAAGLSNIPTVVLTPNSAPVALTTGIGSSSMVVLSRGLLEQLSLRELRSVIAHEIAHIRNNDLPLFAVMGALQQITRLVATALTVLVFLALPALLFGALPFAGRALLYLAIVPVLSLLAQMALLRTREFQADLGAVELTGDAPALASALVRLERLQRTRWPMMMVPGTNRSPFARLVRTHPTTEERVEQLLGLDGKVRDLQNAVWRAS